MVWMVGCSNGTGKVKEQQVCLSVGHECSLAGSCCVLKRKLLLVFWRGSCWDWQKHGQPGQLASADRPILHWSGRESSFGVRFEIIFQINIQRTWNGRSEKCFFNDNCDKTKPLICAKLCPYNAPISTLSASMRKWQVKHGWLSTRSTWSSTASWWTPRYRSCVHLFHTHTVNMTKAFLCHKFFFLSWGGSFFEAPAAKAGAFVKKLY